MFYFRLMFGQLWEALPTVYKGAQLKPASPTARISPQGGEGEGGTGGRRPKAGKGRDTEIPRESLYRGRFPASGRGRRT